MTLVDDQHRAAIWHREAHLFVFGGIGQVEVKTGAPPAFRYCNDAGSLQMGQRIGALFRQTVQHLEEPAPVVVWPGNAGIWQIDDRLANQQRRPRLTRAQAGQHDQRPQIIAIGDIDVRILQVTRLQADIFIAFSIPGAETFFDGPLLIGTEPNQPNGERKIFGRHEISFHESSHTLHQINLPLIALDQSSCRASHCESETAPNDRQREMLSVSPSSSPFSLECWGPHLCLNTCLPVALKPSNLHGTQEILRL